MVIAGVLVAVVFRQATMLQGDFSMTGRRMMALLGAVCFGLAACTSANVSPVPPVQSDPSAQPDTSPQISPSSRSAPTSAVLDPKKASITLPLDGYAMSQKEQYVALAAQKIIFSRCFTGSAKIPDSTMRMVSDLLSQKDEPDWEFGYWSADYIAANGFLSTIEADQFTDELEWTDTEKTEKCHAQDEYLALEPIYVSSAPPKGLLKVLSEASQKSKAKALIDPRFKSLIRRRVQCLDQKGITADGASEIGQASLPEDLTSRAALDVVIADAKCGDELNLVQQMADLVAFYQGQYINDRRSQFTEIKQIADQRFRRAEGVLKDAGIKL